MANYVQYKTTTETIQYTVDFTGILPSTDSTIATSAVTATKSDGTTDNTVITGVSDSGLTITATFTGGTNGEDYLVKFQAPGTTSSKIREVFVELRVRDKLIGVV